MATPGPHDDDNSFERITPITPDTARRPKEAEEPSEAPRSKAWYLPLAFGVLVLALVFVLFWLPDRLSAPETTTQTPQEDPPAKTGEADQTSESAEGLSLAEPIEGISLDAEAILQQRKEADALGERARSQKEALMDRGLSQWAADEAEKLTQLMAGAEELFARRDFPGAKRQYQEALELTEQLQKRADQLLSDSLSRGQEALQAAEDEAAIEAFDLALTLDPDNAQAKEGRRRAENLEQVTAKLNAAEAAEAMGKLEEAKTHYQQALELDEKSQKAQSGLARVEKALLDRAFSGKMSEGMSALRREQYQEAQSASQAALKLREGASEAREGLEQARLGQQKQRIEKLRGQAEEAENNEQWAEARDHYADILAIDGSLAFAQKAHERTRKRARLATRLQAHIDQPSRLTADSVRADAREALARAEAIANPGSKLQSQIKQLRQSLEEATQPVEVTLESDGKTQVIVYPMNEIGQLGQFTTKSLTLTPGHYTAIGRRPGYREVRVSFEVTSEGISDTPVIKSEEPI